MGHFRQKSRKYENQEREEEKVTLVPEVFLSISSRENQAGFREEN